MPGDMLLDHYSTSRQENTTELCAYAAPLMRARVRPGREALASCLFLFPALGVAALIRQCYASLLWLIAARSCHARAIEERLGRRHCARVGQMLL